MNVYCIGKQRPIMTSTNNKDDSLSRFTSAKLLNLTSCISQEVFDKALRLQ